MIKMVTRNISFASDEFYHVYNRGTEKRTIFLDYSDYKRFTELLFLSNSTQSINVRNIRNTHDSIYDFERGGNLVEIGAYCLMSNHFHLLLKQKIEGGISNFMNKLSTSYSMYFNKRYERTGNLFQGRYRAEWINSDEYLKYIYSYIHLNPVKIIDPNWKEKGINDPAAAIKYLRSYEFSSFIDFSLGLPWGEGSRNESCILNLSEFPAYFPNGASFEKEIFEWINFNHEI